MSLFCGLLAFSPDLFLWFCLQLYKHSWNVSGVHGFVSLTLRLPLFVAKKFNVIFVTVKNWKLQNLLLLYFVLPKIICIVYQPNLICKVNFTIAIRILVLTKYTLSKITKLEHRAGYACVDGKTVRIFAYSRMREHSNKRSATRRKAERETGERWGSRASRV